MRRFQQDDAHMPGQVQEEVIGALRFLKFVYTTLQFTEYSVALSTKPKKAMGSKELWDIAEGSLKNALELEQIPYTINHGDGAFYGPKIDIRLTDAIGRKHQCGTIQLDFQLPLRFNLQYKTASKKEEENEAETSAEPTESSNHNSTDLKPGFERPLMVHRAILGSLERMTAVLLEHYAGKWPFWLSPRQVMVCPVSHGQDAYAEYVARQLVLQQFDADVDISSKTLNKKLREAQLAQYNYMAVVGGKEQENITVTLRKRDSDKPFGTFPLQEVIEMFNKERSVNSFNPDSGIEEFVAPTVVEA